jgi:hypothetical protein
MNDSRYRRLFPFRLDVSKQDELEIAEKIETLKQERSFSKTVRDGIRLICDLRKGRTDVLRELFPWVLEQQPEPQPQRLEEVIPISSAEQALSKQIERLETLILQQGAIPIPAGQKPSEAPPIEDDFEIEIKTASRDEDNNSTWNFMLASAINVYGNYDGLPDKIIEYGLRTGRISPDKVKKKPIPQATGSPRKLANSDLSFAIPDFDDMDLTL